MKIQSRKIRKGYKREKDAYNYTQHLLPFPIAQNEELKPFLKKELQFSMSVKDDTIFIALKKPKEKPEVAPRDQVSPPNSEQKS